MGCEVVERHFEMAQPTKKHRRPGVQPSGTPHMITYCTIIFHIVNPSHHTWVVKDSKLQ